MGNEWKGPLRTFDMRSQIALENVQALAKSTKETLETLHLWYMMPDLTQSTVFPPFDLLLLRDLRIAINLPSGLNLLSAFSSSPLRRLILKLESEAHDTSVALQKFTRILKTVLPSFKGSLKSLWVIPCDMYWEEKKDFAELRSFCEVQGVALSLSSYSSMDDE